jgi:hypothetical protein
MKIQVRSSFNGLAQEVDINMAGCGGLCPDTETPPVPMCENSLPIVDGVADNGGSVYLSSPAQLGSAYGAGAPLDGQFVLGYALINFAAACENEFPPAVPVIELLFNDVLFFAATVVFEPTQNRSYFIAPENTQFPADNGCFSFGNSYCVPVETEACEGGFLIDNSSYEGGGSVINSPAQLGSAYGVSAPLDGQYVLGYLSNSPVPGCEIEPPGTSTATINLLFDAAAFVTATVVFEPTQSRYYLVVPEGTDLPETAGCLTFGNSSCVSS